MSQILKEAGWLKTWISKITNRKTKEFLPKALKDPGMQKQAKKVIAAFDKWEKSLDDAEAYADFLRKKYRPGEKK